MRKMGDNLIHWSGLVHADVEILSALLFNNEIRVLSNIGVKAPDNYIAYTRIITTQSRTQSLFAPRMLRLDLFDGDTYEKSCMLDVRKYEVISTNGNYPLLVKRIDKIVTVKTEAVAVPITAGTDGELIHRYNAYLVARVENGDKHV